MRKLRAAGAVAAGALVLSLQAGAGTVTYTITNGAFGDSEASCTRITTNLGNWDCSYGNELPRAILTYLRPKWLGPTFGGGHYQPGSIQSDPAYRVPAGTGTGGTTTGTASGTPRVFSPAIDDGKYAAPITGTFTIDDNGTPMNPLDDKISSSFSIGALVRNFRTGQSATAVQTWTSYDHEIAPFTVSSATGNANGGYDYIIGSRGWPTPICAVYDGSDCFSTPDTMADFQTPAGFWSQTNDPNYVAQIGIERTGVLADPNFYTTTPMPPANPPTGNVGATSTGSMVDMTCAYAYDNPSPSNPDDCAVNQLVWGATEPYGFDNIVMKISTDNTGAITSAQAYWSEEYYISYQSAPPDYDNSVDTGTFSFTAPAPGPTANSFTFGVLEGSSGNILNTAANCVNFVGAVTVSLVAPAATLGTTSVDGNQNVVYDSTGDPNTPGGTGPDPVGYQCSNGVITRQGTVTVNVETDISPVAPDTSLVISTQNATPGPGTAGIVNVSGLTGYIAGNTPSVITIIDPQPTKGTATVSGTTITYTPYSTFYYGTDAIQYRITDGQGDMDDGTIGVNIADIAPVLANGTITTNQDKASTPVSLVITAGNGTIANSPVTVTTQAANGTCAVTGTATARTITYTPAAGYVGTDSCTLTITDADDKTDNDTGSGTFTITVNATENALQLPGGSGAVDLWSLALLGALPLWRRRRRI